MLCVQCRNLSENIVCFWSLNDISLFLFGSVPEYQLAHTIDEGPQMTDWSLVDGRGYILDRHCSHTAASRLDLQFYLWKDALQFNIHPSILPSRSKHAVIADVASGSCIWLIDVSRQLPEAQLDGFDFNLRQSPHQQWLPSNVNVRHWNILEDVPGYLVGKYDCDLFVGMKGTGHNFATVTSFEMNNFPRGPDTWHYHNYIWRGDKLEDIFNALNVLRGNGTTPVNMTFDFGVFSMNTTITKEEPIIWWTFAYCGTAEKAEQHLARFNTIKSIYDEFGEVPYLEISIVRGNGEDGFICQDNQVRITATAGLNASPDNKNPDNSAYAFRAERYLMLIQIIIPPDSSSIEHAAWEWAKEVRAQWNDGQPERPIDAYVNYANGFEPVEQWYGHEAWRLERLRDLKARYDPYNRFRYYNPIIKGNTTVESPYNKARSS
ncbi:MAG: hypothetical protein Q9157_007383 [Trypethelium eluteriae]